MQHHHTPLFALHMFRKPSSHSMVVVDPENQSLYRKRGWVNKKGVGTPWYQSHASTTAKQSVTKNILMI